MLLSLEFRLSSVPVSVYIIRNFLYRGKIFFSNFFLFHFWVLGFFPVIFVLDFWVFGFVFGFGFFIQILVCSSIFHYWVLGLFFVIGFLGLFRYWVFGFFFSVIFVLLPLLIFYFCSSVINFLFCSSVIFGFVLS